MSLGIVFAGSESGNWVPSDSGAIESTANGFFDPAYCRLCLTTQYNSGSYWTSTKFTSLSSFWLHMSARILGSYSNSNVPFYNLMDNTGQVVFYMTSPQTSGGSTITINMYYWAGGTTYNQIGSGFVTSEYLGDLDFNIQLGSGGFAKVYASGNLRDSGSANMTGANLSQMSILNQVNSNSACISQVIVSDVSTIGAKLTTLPITGNGITNAWSGSYTNVNETITNDGNFITSGTANQVSNFACVNSVSGAINAVIVTARALAGATGPQHLELDVNTNATDYFSSSSALGTGLGGTMGIWQTNPHTSVAWQPADINTGFYCGVKSLA